MTTDFTPDPRVVGFFFVDDESVPYPGSGFHPGVVPPTNAKHCEPLVKLSDLKEVESLLEDMKKSSRPLTQWMHCLSYNESYVGEPAGAFKRAAYSLNRFSDPKPKPSVSDTLENSPTES